MKKTQVARLLAYVTGMVNQQLLLQNEYLITENRILRSHLPARVRLTDPQRVTLAAIAKRLGRQALEHVALVAKPETILGWYPKLIAQKFDGPRYFSFERVNPVLNLFEPGPLVASERDSQKAPAPGLQHTRLQHIRYKS